MGRRGTNEGVGNGIEGCSDGIGRIGDAPSAGPGSGVSNGRKRMHERGEHLVVARVERIDPPGVVSARADPRQHLASSDQRQAGSDNPRPRMGGFACGFVSAQRCELIDRVGQRELLRSNGALLGASRRGKSEFDIKCGFGTETTRIVGIPSGKE